MEISLTGYSNHQGEIGQKAPKLFIRSRWPIGARQLMLGGESLEKILDFQIPHGEGLGVVSHGHGS